jgi:hypothetical protein
MRLAGSLIVFDVGKRGCVEDFDYSYFGVIVNGISLTNCCFVAGKFCTVGIDTCSVASKV